MGLVVTCPTAPSQTQACDPRPSGNHGAKWSEAPRPSKPASSAAFACSIISEGVNSSVEAANQYCVPAIGAPFCSRADARGAPVVGPYSPRSPRSQPASWRAGARPPGR